MRSQYLSVEEESGYYFEESVFASHFKKGAVGCPFALGEAEASHSGGALREVGDEEGQNEKPRNSAPKLFNVATA